MTETITAEYDLSVPGPLQEFYVTPDPARVADRLTIHSKYGSWDPASFGTGHSRALDARTRDVAATFEGAMFVEHVHQLDQAAIRKRRHDDAQAATPVYACAVCSTDITAPATFRTTGNPGDMRGQRPAFAQQARAMVCTSCADDIELRIAVRRVTDPKHAKALDAVITEMETTE